MISISGTSTSSCVSNRADQTEQTKQLINLESQGTLAKGAVQLVPPSQARQGFLSTMFLVPKKGVGQRPVVNLLPQNHFLPYEVQTGGDSYVEGSFKKRRLLNQNRPQGCIFYSPCLPRTPEAHTISVRGNSLRIHLPTLPFGSNPTGIHQGLETGGGLVEAIGNKAYNLSRRHSNSSPL